MSTIYRRGARFGEGVGFDATFGGVNLTYGGWFPPQAEFLYLGGVYCDLSPTDNIRMDESPTGAAHFVEQIEGDIYEV